MAELIHINDKKQEKLNYIIGNLPADILNLIYIDYVKPDLILMEVVKELYVILNSDDSMSLDSTPLETFLRNHVLQNSVVIQHLIKNDKEFQLIYEIHIIQGKKVFECFPDIVSSMAACWLMYLHH
jgi:hypothetical protein